MKNYYLLIHNYNNKTLFLKLPKKHYVFMVDNLYFYYKNSSEEFTLKEKLCVIDHNTNVTWKKISPLAALLNKIFFNITTPNNFEIFAVSHKLTVIVNGKVECRLIIK